MKSCIVLIYIITIYLVTYGSLSAQSISKHRSVMGVSGYSGKVCIDGKSYSFQQSIGQTGVNGTFCNDNIVIIQGFIHPILTDNYFFNFDELDVIIKTIPFSDTYVITVNDLNINFLSVKLYNISGQQIYAEEIKNTKEFSINLSSWSSACYLLFIQANKKQFATKLIKN